MPTDAMQAVSFKARGSFDYYSKKHLNPPLCYI